MKRIFAALVLCAVSLCAMAQGGIPLLDKVQGHRVSFHYTYSLSQKGEEFKPITSGHVTVEDNAYKLEGLNLEVRSDGTTRWTVDPKAKEVVVETITKEDLYSNPALFIGSYKKYLDRIKVNGSGENWLDVTLTLDDDTQARFLLKDIVFGPKQGKSDFPMDEKSLPSTYLMTDLR